MIRLTTAIVILWVAAIVKRCYNGLLRAALRLLEKHNESLDDRLWEEFKDAGERVSPRWVTLSREKDQVRGFVAQLRDMVN